MKIIPFEDLYSFNFIVNEPLVKPQNWYNRKNIYSCIGKPKPSHTFLWFKNCNARITTKSGLVLNLAKNQMAYMSKGIEYIVEFFDTSPENVDSIVIHFQLKDMGGNDISPTLKPVICIKNVDFPLQNEIEKMSDEFKKNIYCVPDLDSLIYKIFAVACKRQRRHIVKNKYQYIQKGIELLESNSNLSITEIAELCCVSEGHFRKLFREYSGENPVDYRKKHRIEKAKQLLLLDTLSIGEIAAELHFSDIYHFSKTFKQLVGISPQKYIKDYFNNS